MYAIKIMPHMIIEEIICTITTSLAENYREIVERKMRIAISTNDIPMLKDALTTLHDTSVKKYAYECLIEEVSHKTLPRIFFQIIERELINDCHISFFVRAKLWAVCRQIEDGELNYKEAIEALGKLLMTYAVVKCKDDAEWFLLDCWDKACNYKQANLGEII